MNQPAIQRVYRVTTLIAVAADIFIGFFQVNKGGPFRDLNPFTEDPYDAVGSFAVQIAFMVGLLTFARGVRLVDDPAQAAKTRLILRGDLVVVLAMLVTLLADAVAVVLHPPAPSFWGTVLLAELGLMLLLALVCAVALAVLYRRTPAVAPPRDLTPADAIDDLWALLRVPVKKHAARLPRPLVDWVLRFHSDWLFARAPALNPRTHPWRFACALGLVVGIGLALAQLQDGLPSSLEIGLLLAAIFISGEFAATMIGFAVFGGYLGLRPAFGQRD